MSVTPTISLVAYEARDKRVFVKVPDERGRYLLTDRSVIEVECSMCGSARGEPCRGRHGYTAATHFTRRKQYRSARGGWTIPAGNPDQLDKPRVKLILPRQS